MESVRGGGTGRSDSEREFLARLGGCIRDVRVGEGFSLRELGIRMGESRAESTISQYEGGTRRISLYGLLLLSRALGIRWFDLMEMVVWSFSEAEGGGDGEGSG